MNQLLDLAGWREAFLQQLSDLVVYFAGVVPGILGAVLIVLLGWLVARSVQLAVARVLRLFGLDGAATRLRLNQVIERAGLRMTVSEMLARALFWLLMLAFLLSAVQALGVAAVTETVDRLVGFIPNLLGAILIAGFGFLFARFVGAVASSGAAAAGVANAPRVGFLVSMLVSALVLVLAAEQLGIDTSVLVGPLTAVLATAGLAAGLSFALGAYPIVTHILAGHFLKQSLPRDSLVEVGGGRGIVERIGATDTLLRSGEECWSIPNGQLLELIVKR